MLELIKWFDKEHLGEAICNLFFGRNEPNLQFLVCNPFTCKVKVNLNMFSSSMKGGIG